MSSYKDTYSLWENPAITERHHRLLWIVIQGVAFGAVLGLISRAAWDLGVIGFLSLALRDFAVAIWAMFQGLPDACMDFFQEVIR